MEINSHGDVVRFAVHVTPNAKRASVGGTHDGALRVAVTAAPEDGKANKAVIQAIADALKIKKSGVDVISGHSSRRKVIACSCDDNEAVRTILEQLAQ